MLANLTNEANMYFLPGDFGYFENKSFIQKPAGTATAIININGEWIEIDASQEWFWTKEWQAGERKVEEYIQAGNIQTFDNIDEFLNSLEE